ncbi:hypothetical protein ADL15_49480 [Actinoplanes awajinensis subsp. mycoplanecinus]|uniref:Uncharacterized protein n=1 Tax=Actinoplanes awajinensis subsp. mycoplanecinus TaxID=135947 RepID=A0A101J878_9ACTN|nr:hypothetical protein ADL15_49480 [Actinoplanes awajinensis subsp. mycoplanecinus]
MSHDNPFPQDPTTVVPPAKAPRKGAGFATFLALVAVLLAAGAAALAWHAGTVASEAADKVDELAAKQASAAAAPTTAPPADPTAAPATTGPAEPAGATTTAAVPDGSTPPLSATTLFTQKYLEKNLVVPSDCNSSVYIDLDDPKVQVDPAVSELSYYNFCNAGNTPYLSLQAGVEGTAYDSEAFDPGDCVSQIVLKPLAKEGRLPVRQGQVYCLTTSSSAAQKAGVPRRLVSLTVTGVAKDGALAIKATAWDAPNS